MSKKNQTPNISDWPHQAADMPAEPATPKESLSGAFKRSLIAHIIFAIIAILTNFTFFGKPVEYKPSIRVDLVALPDIKKSDVDKYMPADLSDLEKKLNQAEKGAKENTTTLKKEKNKIVVDDDVMSMKKKDKKNPKNDALKSAVDRIKAIEAIENEVQKDKRNKVQAKGNILSKGDSMTGDVSETGSDTNAYVSRMQSKLRENWNLPVWLTKQDLSAKVVIFLDRSGFIRHAVFSKNSGNPQFDDYVLKTIKMSQPFGNPPSEIQETGITLGFPL